MSKLSWQSALTLLPISGWCAGGSVSLVLVPLAGKSRVFPPHCAAQSLAFYCPPPPRVTVRKACFSPVNMVLSYNNNDRYPCAVSIRRHLASQTEKRGAPYCCGVGGSHQHWGRSCLLPVRVGHVSGPGGASAVTCVHLWPSVRLRACPGPAVLRSDCSLLLGKRRWGRAVFSAPRSVNTTP